MIKYKIYWVKNAYTAFDEDNTARLIFLFLVDSNIRNVPITIVL